MTFNDLLVIVIGSVALLVIFLAVQAVLVARTVDLWAVVRRYVALRLVENDPQSNEFDENSPATTTPQNSNNGIATPATVSNELLLQAKAEALAAMVKAGKIGETEGIKLVFGVAPSSSNPRYQAARAALKTELERLTNPYPNMTPEQKRAREVLGLSK